MEDKAKLLSKELLVATEIHRLEEAGEIVHFNRLVETLADLGLIKSKTTVRRALNTLFDQGMVKASWTVRPSDGKHIRKISCAGEAKSFIEGIYRRTRL